MASLTTRRRHIVRVTYRSNKGRKRVGTTLVKIPYGGIFSMTEVLGRALSVGEIMWFRVEAPQTITDTDRDTLKRWPEALAETSKQTLVRFGE